MKNEGSSSPPPLPKKDKIGVLVVDDHAIVRQGLRTFIDLQEDMEVVGEGTNGLEAVELAARLNPGVILLDLIMPEMDGVEATRKILASLPQSHILILTSFGEDDKVFPAIRAGAQGYLLKDIQPRELVQAVRESYRGKAQLHPDIARRLMAAVSGDGRAGGAGSGSPPRDLQKLTGREREVLDLIANGLSNHEIAGKLFISEMTVKTHVSNILGKLGLADRTQAAIYALKRELPGDQK